VEHVLSNPHFEGKRNKEDKSKKLGLGQNNIYSFVFLFFQAKKKLLSWHKFTVEICVGGEKYNSPIRYPPKVA
jgi:hypothetical protein